MAGLGLMIGVFARYSPQGRYVLKLIRPGEILMAALLLAVVVAVFVWLNKMMDEEQARRGQ
jgi:hypothetical protein